MNAFVAGNVNEVKKLGTFLIEAANAVDQSIKCITTIYSSDIL